MGRAELRSCQRVSVGEDRRGGVQEVGTKMKTDMQVRGKIRAEA